MSTRNASQFKQSQNLAKVRRPHTRRRIPARLSRKSRRPTTETASVRDIREGGVATRVQPGIEEAHGWSVCGDQGVVDEREDASGCWTRGAGAAYSGARAVPDNGEVVGLCG